MEKVHVAIISPLISHRLVDRQSSYARTIGSFVNETLIRTIRFTALLFFRTDHSTNLHLNFHASYYVPTRCEYNIIEKHALKTWNDRTSIPDVSTSTKAPFPLERSMHRATSRGFCPSCKVGGEYSFHYCVKPPVG